MAASILTQLKSPASSTIIAKSVTFAGIDAEEVEVQVLISSGLPTFSIVGLANKAVAESRDRIRAAFYSLGIGLPAKRITVNLAPADIQKDGSHYDLPISLALMGAIGVIPPDCIDDYVVLGELGLDGSIAAVAGVLPTAIYAASLGLGVICPQQQGSEALWGGEDLKVIAAPSLIDLINHFKGTSPLPPPNKVVAKPNYGNLDMVDIHGQQAAKRCLEVAATGCHNVAFVGSPGAGKSMLAARLPSIMPLLNPAEALEVTMVHSLARQLSDGKLITSRPFRDPHHSASVAAIAGGGQKALPGELSLAHCGVLFLDELPEFKRSALETMRQPLETGYITIARANSHITYPAKFQLIAAMNPCRCGYLGDPARACSRAPGCGRDYLKSISGPLLDRFDMMIEIAPLPPREMLAKSNGETSAIIRNRVNRARQFAAARSQRTATASIADNADKAALDLLVDAGEKLHITARGFDRVLKVARTIADLDTSERVSKRHVAEAIAYRRLIGVA